MCCLVLSAGWVLDPQDTHWLCQPGQRSAAGFPWLGGAGCHPAPLVSGSQVVQRCEAAVAKIWPVQHASLHGHSFNKAQPSRLPAGPAPSSGCPHSIIGALQAGSIASSQQESPVRQTSPLRSGLAGSGSASSPPSRHHSVLPCLFDLQHLHSVFFYVGEVRTGTCLLSGLPAALEIACCRQSRWHQAIHASQVYIA